MGLLGKQIELQQLSIKLAVSCNRESILTGCSYAKIYIFLHGIQMMAGKLSALSALPSPGEVT